MVQIHAYNLDDLLVKKPESQIIDCEHPLLAGCKRYLIGLDPKIATEDVAGSAYALAKDIMDYYGKKVMWLTLKGNRVSTYKRDMIELFGYDLESKRFPNKFLGIGYKLPVFYANDLKLEKEIMAGANTIVPELDDNWTTKTLTYIDTIKTNQTAKSFELQFWFKDEDNNRVRLCVRRDNPLLPLLRHAIKHPIAISGSYRRKGFYEISYYELGSVAWSVV